MENSRDVLTQEEISALLEKAHETTASESNEEGAATLKKEENQYKQYWKKGSSNIISAEELDSFDENDKKKRMSRNAAEEKYIKSTRVKLKYRLKKSVPFLELLLEYGNGELKKGDSVELSTMDGDVIKGFFEGFFYEKKNYEGGMLIKSGDNATSVLAGNIAINTDGGFIIHM
ncbi:MAG: hypothetical protein ACE5FU_03295 [Nitrospinota bacterium]